jgi:hypothetical protein
MSRICIRCDTKKSNSEFYERCDRTNKVQSYCKQCNKDLVIERKKELKRKCVEYKGGVCESCGYNKCMAALEFHHKYNKEFGISTIRITSWDKNKEKLIKELDKCMLLCANCHREIENTPAPI